MKEKIKQSLSAKLALFFISSLSIIMIGVVLLSSLYTNKSFNEYLQKDVDTSLKGLSETIKDYKNQINTVGNELANSAEFINNVNFKNTYAITSTIMSAAKENGISYIVVMDTNGKVIAKNTTEELDYDNYSKLNHVQKAMQGKENISTEVIADKNLCLCNGAPIKDGSKLMGYISTVQSLKDNKFIDDLKNVCDSDFTIFLGSEPINTTIVKDNKRQLNIKPDSKIIDRVLKNKQNYSGKTNILGSTYMCSYSPILDGQNAVGIMFSGKNIDSTERIINITVLVSIIFSVLLLIIVTIILTKFIKKLVRNPLNQIVSLANNMEKGEIGISNKDAVQLTINSEDEVGQVADALGNTVSSLQMYVGEISNVLSAIAQGDLTIKPQNQYYGDFKNIKEALDNIVKSLNSILSNISSAAESVALHSEQISNNATDLSQGATEQASSVEELSATINEINNQIQKTAENASVASVLALKSSDEVNNGKVSLDNMLNSMDKISKASAEISKINKTIEDIAFQTNILSLNAAVEAARAGAAGKGFAVVAGEVRNLASKSAQAAKQTSSLIQNTVDLVEQGTKIAKIASESFMGIISSSQESTKLIEQISEAATQEASAVAQVSLGVNQITQVVQNNSATSEENAAASNELSQQAKLLQNLVKNFKLDESYISLNNYNTQTRCEDDINSNNIKCDNANKYE